MARLDPEAASLTSLHATLGQAVRRFSIENKGVGGMGVKRTRRVLALICLADIFLQDFCRVDLWSLDVCGSSRQYAREIGIDLGLSAPIVMRMLGS